MTPWRGTAAGPALQRDGAACRERRVRRQDRDAARHEAVCTGADAPRLAPLTHPTTLVRYRLPRVLYAMCRPRQPTAALLAGARARGADGVAAAAEQAGHHLRRPRALWLGCIGPATHPPASGANRGCRVPSLGRIRLALGPGWRPSTPSFAPLLLESVASSRSVPFGTMQPPFFSFSRVWVRRDLSGGMGGASMRACLAKDVLMHVHSCAFVPCSPPRLVSPTIVFSGN